MGAKVFRYMVYRWDKHEPDAGFRSEDKARQYRRLSSAPDALRIRDEQTRQWLPERNTKFGRTTEAEPESSVA